MKMRQCFGRKTEVKRELAKCRSRWQDDIKMDGKETAMRMCTCLVWFMARDSGRAVVNTVTNNQRL